MDTLWSLLHKALHLDELIKAQAAALGPWVYVLLFLIVFCETGLVVTPFLPGDSLLFACGALAADPLTGLNVVSLAAILIVAAVLGDAANYSIGSVFGRRMVDLGSRWLNAKHLERTHDFYERHGGKTIVFARFVPIVRTFAPFVAGMGRMSYRRFALFNVVGALVWVIGLVALGHVFGNLPMVKRNFEFVVLGIIVISLVPMVVEYLRARAAARERG